MLRPLVRALGEALVRLYYPERLVSVTGGGALPPSGPVIYVLNHPNGLLDPLVLRVAARRPVRFLAKSTLFGSPLGRLAMEAFGSVPVFRASDGGADRAAGNEATFARCRALLSAGEALALFPEGVSHSDPQLKPLRTGAARLALSAAAEHRARTGQALALTIVPVGLGYERKATFRSRVLLVVGRPIPVDDRLQEHQRDERAAVSRLTDDIKAALDEVVLQAETRDLLEGVSRVAAWTAPAGEAPDPAELHARARELLAAYARLRERAPERVEPIVRAARDYGRVLRRLGVRDPWALECERVRPARALAAIALLVLAAPAALLGALLAWVPYRLAGEVARRVAREEDVLGTVKLLAGALFVALGWAGAATAAGLWGGAPWAAAVAVAAPAGGWVALRFEELWAVTRESLRHLWLRGARGDQVLRLARRRRALAEEIERALRQV